MREKRTSHPLGRRIMAAMLAMCMLLAMAPAAAAAGEPIEYSLDNGDVSIDSTGVYKITQANGDSATTNTITVTASGDVTLILDGINIAASNKAAISANCPSLTLRVAKTSRLSAESAQQEANKDTGAIANIGGKLSISATDGAALDVSATDKTSDVRPVRGIYFKDAFENSAKLTVSAESKALNTSYNNTYAIHGLECSSFTNSGTLNLTAHTTNGPAYGICIDAAKNLVFTNENAGKINANATALGGKDVAGFIGTGNSNYACGIKVIETNKTPSSIVNKGELSITATNPGENEGALEYAVGIQMDCNGAATLDNSGTITVEATEADSSAINLQTYGPTAKLVNSGTLDLTAATQGRTKTGSFGEAPCFAVGIQLVTAYGGTEYPQLVLEEGSDVRISTALSANAAIDEGTAKAEGRLMAAGIQRVYCAALDPRPEQVVLADSIQIVSPAGGTFAQKDDADVQLDTLVDSEGNIACEAALKTAEAYTITFNASGGGVEPASLQTNMDGKLASLPTPTHSGSYRFLGWFTSESGGDAITTDTIFDSDTTVYAHWERIVLNKVYVGGVGCDDAHDGSSPENAVATANKAVELAAPGGTVVVCGDTTAPTSKTLVENKPLTFTNTDGVKTYNNAVLCTYFPTFLSDVTLEHVAWKDMYKSNQCEVGKNVTLTLDTVTTDIIPPSSPGHPAVGDFIRFITARATGAHLIIRNSNFSGKVSYLCQFETITLDHSVATALYTNSFPSDASDFILKNGSTLSVSKDIKTLASEGEGNTIQARKTIRENGKTKLVPVSILDSVTVETGNPITLTNYFLAAPADGAPYLTSIDESLTVDKFTLSGEKFTPVKYNSIIYAASRSVSTLVPANITARSADLRGAAATQFPLDGTEFVWWKSGDEGAKQSLVTTVNNGDNTFSAALSGLAADTLYYFRAVATVGGMRCEGNTLSFRTKPEATPTGSIEGSVTNNTGVQCDITVTIEEGNTVRATQVLSNVVDSTSSSFSFSALPDGFYNVVADNGAYKVTRLVEIKDSAAVVNVKLALGKTQSVVEIVTPDTPPTAVDGLPEQFEEKATTEDEGYTAANESVVQSGGTVELKLAVERKNEGAVSDDAALIAGVAAGQTIPIYLDLSVIKTVIPTSGAATETKLVSVPKLLTVVLLLPDEAVGKQNITIYRVHNGSAAALPKADPGGDGEWSEISGGNAILHIRQFSTYAVGYTAPTPPVNPGHSGGGNTGYPPNINSGEHGNVAVSPKNPGSGDRVTITPKPDEGYIVDEVVVIDKNGKEVAVKDNGDGSYTFTQPVGKATITVTFKPIPPMWNPFNDVAEKDWFHDSVRYVYENGLMNGTSDTTFSPYLSTDRGMIVTILWHMEGSPAATTAADFTDVAPSGQYYSDAVAWGAEKGIVKGYGNGNYGPGDPITREQLASILWRYAQYKDWDVSIGENTNILSYLDYPQISEYAIPALQWAAGAEIISGKGGGILDPRGHAIRAEAAAMLERFLKDNR